MGRRRSLIILERRHCCGFGFRQYLVQANRGYSVACSKEKFESMKAI